MGKKLLLIARLQLIVLCALLSTASIIAQPYNNEWIQYNQTYYKIKTVNNGLHRISYNTLSAMGLPADASGYQLYHNGIEIPLYISANTLTANDYIEFMGKKNDGQLDADLYQNTDLQLSPYKSLFSDTSAYFLIWSNPNVGIRFSNISNDIATPPPTETHFTHTSTVLYANTFFAGQPSFGLGNWLNFSDFEACEGWISLLIQAGQTQNFNIPTRSVYTNASTPAQCTVRIAGRNNEAGTLPEHPIQIAVNGTIYKDTIMEGYYCEKLRFDLPLNALGNPQTTVNLTALANGSSTNNNSVAYLQITFPHSYDFENKRNFAFTLPDQTERYLEISNFDGGSAPILYDLTNHWRIVPIVQNGVYKIKLPEGIGTNERRLFISNTTTSQALTDVTQLQERHFTNYNTTEHQGNYLIIAHSTLTQGTTNQVQRYANYRQSYMGGGFDVVTADIEELYDQFAFGIPKHPLAIVNLVNFARNTWPQQPTHLLLLGKALSYSDITTATTAQQCLVPTFGNVPSDMMLSSQPKIGEWIPQIATGRVPARTADELRAYIDKLFEYEASNSDIVCELNDIWRKNVISLATSNNPSQTEVYANEVMAFQNELTNSDFAAYPLGIYQQVGSSNTPIPEFENAINNGLGIIFFKGEQQNFYWRMDIHTPNFYQNGEGRYPFIFSQSEFIGNLHRTSSTMANDFILADGKGAIGFLDNAQKYYGTYSDTLLKNLVTRLHTTGYTHSIGQNILQTIQELGLYFDPLSKYVSQNYTLAGDPALSVVPNRKVELSVQPENLSFYNVQNGDPLFTDPIYIGHNMPNFEARLLIHNTGRYINDSVNVKVTRWLPNGNFIDVITQRVAIPAYNTLVSIVLPNDLPEFSGPNTYFFTVDADNEAVEWCENNNAVLQPADINPYIVGIIPTAPIATNYYLYPVPTQNDLFITAPTPTQVRLFDAKGRMVQQQKLLSGLNTIDVSTLTSGYYCVQLQNETVVINRPLIIVK